MAIPTYTESPDQNSTDRLKFPDDASSQRLNQYEHYDLVQIGQQYNAFNISSKGAVNEQMAKLRYVVANYAGMISKISADISFLDPVKFKLKGDANQQLVDALDFNNRMAVQNYESAVSNSARGDAVYKLRIGKRYPTDAKATIIIENISPYIYFPNLDSVNMQGSPSEETLAWFVKFGKNTFVRKEIHTAGLITNELWSYDNRTKKLVAQIPWTNYYDPSVDPETVETRITKNLIVHIPNWRIGTEYFGISDYVDLDTLFYALNNRITKVDNVLDTHSDPILAIPDGLLNDDGEVRRENLQLIEIPADSNGTKPEYIVWNANLEAAFTEIDKLIEFLDMFSETSPDTRGMGKGQSDSGRALKYKLLRTLAKVKRKQLYYRQGLKEVMTIAQELFMKWPEVEVVMDGIPVPRISNIETPEVEFSDRYVYDSLEAAQEEQIRLSSGNTTAKESVMRLDQVDDKTAEATVKEINDEKGLNLPLTTGFQQPADTTKPTNQDQSTNSTGR